MKQWKKLLAVFMAGAILITGDVLPQESAAAESAVDYSIRNPRVDNGVTTWDKIKFGSYYQDAEVQPEPIKWRVLSVDGDDAFLLADQILDAKPYNEKQEDVTWETCTLREWLNKNFYNEAFNDEEKKAVIETVVVNENNPVCNTEGGNDTKDKVYLLSIAEASDATYGFDTEFTELTESSKTRRAKNTDIAKVNNVWSSTYDGTVGVGYWWLRSVGCLSNNALYVDYDGCGNDFGYSVNYGKFGVRPALHINLSSSEVEDAGEVDSEGNVTMLDNGISNPVVKNGVTTWDCVYFGNYRQN
ncbi:MAG: hypothetical protein K2K09_02765, partial [Lachnospiraceae bacterium]|nr:hypothetical protein [Lachnospiraceae bacterium]